MSRKKINVLISVVFVFVLFLIVVWAFNSSSIYLLQGEILHWNYFSHILMLMFSIGAITLTKRNFRSMGFTFKNWRSDIRIAVPCVIIAAGYIPGLVFPTIATNEPLNLGFKITATITALLVVSRERIGNDKTTSSKTARQLILLLPVFSISAAATNINFGLIASTVIFQFFFVGFGEEIMFRGYMQSTLNEGFGYSWKFAGVRFGPGLLITSALFGVLHLLNPFNPLQEQYSLAVYSGIGSTFTGFLFGFVREKTGNVLAPSIAHGLVNLGMIIPLL